jgi:hypothetical protein
MNWKSKIFNLIYLLSDYFHSVELFRVGLYPIISQSHLTAGKLNGKEWVEYVIAEVGVGGRGGGKAV